MEGLEHFLNFKRVLLEHDEHETAHQEGAVGLHCKIIAAVMKELLALVLRVYKKSHELSHVLVHLSEV